MYWLLGCCSLKVFERKCKEEETSCPERPSSADIFCLAFFSLGARPTLPDSNRHPLLPTDLSSLLRLRPQISPDHRRHPPPIVIIIVFRLVQLPFVIFHPSPPRQFRPLTSPAARALTHYGFPTPPKSLAAWSDWWLARVAGQGHRAEKVHEAHKQLGECD